MGKQALELSSVTYRAYIIYCWSRINAFFLNSSVIPELLVCFFAVLCMIITAGLSEVFHKLKSVNHYP